MKDQIMKIVGRKYKNLKSSSLQSIERGRKSEIKYLNGFVVQEGDKLGLNVPYNVALTKIVTLIDEKVITYSPSNIQKIADELNIN